MGNDGLVYAAASEIRLELNWCWSGGTLGRWTLRDGGLGGKFRVECSASRWEEQILPLDVLLLRGLIDVIAGRRGGELVYEYCKGILK